MIPPEGKIVIITLGNDLRGDDTAGVLFGSIIKGNTPFDVFEGFDAPENITRLVIESRPDIILIADAMDFGGNPGDVKLASSDDLGSDSISTHGTLGLFVNYLQKETGAVIYILGFQPKSLELGTEISPEVSHSVKNIAEEFMESDSYSRILQRLTAVR